MVDRLRDGGWKEGSQKRWVSVKKTTNLRYCVKICDLILFCHMTQAPRLWLVAHGGSLLSFACEKKNSWTLPLFRISPLPLVVRCFFSGDRFLQRPTLHPSHNSTITNFTISSPRPLFNNIIMIPTNPRMNRISISVPLDARRQVLTVTSDTGS
jgi:hypothetical protein